MERLKQMNCSELSLLKNLNFTDLTTYNIFCKLWWRSGLMLRKGDKSIPILIARAFAHYPVSGQHVIRLGEGCIGLKTFEMQLLNEVAICRKNNSPINWFKLIEQLYQRGY
jgi:hypothetical protein